MIVTQSECIVMAFRDVMEFVRIKNVGHCRPALMKSASR
jgi:hypothetical protein